MSFFVYVLTYGITFFSILFQSGNWSYLKCMTVGSACICVSRTRAVWSSDCPKVLIIPAGITVISFSSFFKSGFAKRNGVSIRLLPLCGLNTDFFCGSDRLIFSYERSAKIENVCNCFQKGFDVLEGQKSRIMKDVMLYNCRCFFKSNAYRNIIYSLGMEKLGSI